MKYAFLVTVMVLASSTGTGGAEPTAADADVAAIRASVESYVAAYNRGDAPAVAAHWSETGQWISPAGDRVQGRAAIQEELRAMFDQGQGGKVEVSDVQVRLLSADVAMEEGVARVTQPGEVPSTSRYLALHVKKQGQWQLDCIREAETPSETPARDNLKQLEWLVGDWVDEGNEAVVEHSCRWSEDGHYLLGSFTLRLEGRPAMTVSVRIGWDPLRRQIRSWVFDTEGGFAEGLWTGLGDRWVVKMTGVRPDGVAASATQVYQLLRRDAFRVTSLDRIVGDEEEPDQSVTVVRKPPQPGSRPDAAKK